MTQRISHHLKLRAGRLASLLACGLAATAAVAQPAEMATLRDSSAWLTAENAAALTQMRQRGMAVAEVYGQSAHGGLTDFWASPSTVDAGAVVESYLRLSPRTVVYGLMSYNGQRAHQVAGSVFFRGARDEDGIFSRKLSSYLAPRTSHKNSRSLPFDIVEDSLTNQGRIHSDTYRMVGAVGSSIWRWIAVGAKIDFTAANMAKYKDLRHSNKLTDLSLTAGITATPTPWLTLGGNLHYRRDIESVNFSLFGREEKVYKSLIAYGAFMGRVEQFGNYGYTNNFHEMPLYDEERGFGLQAEARLPRVLSLYSAFHYAYRRGYYGRRSAYTITYTGHSSNIFGYEGRIAADLPRSRHALRMSLSAENLANHANVWRELRNDNGSSYYEYFAPVKTANKLLVEGEATYTARFFAATRYSSPRSPSPYLTLMTRLNWMHRKQTAYDFPFLRRQRLNVLRASALASRRFRAPSFLAPHIPERRSPTRSLSSFPAPRASIDITLGCFFQRGHGQPFEDSTLAPLSDAQEQPQQMEVYLMREHGYLTLPQHGLQASVTYAMPISGTRTSTYLDLSATHRKSDHHDRWMTGHDRTTLRITLGCLF